MRLGSLGCIITGQEAGREVVISRKKEKSKQNTARVPRTPCDGRKHATGKRKDWIQVRPVEENVDRPIKVWSPHRGPSRIRLLAFR